MTSNSESISIADWLATRAPAPPDALQRLLHELVGSSRCSQRELSSTLVQIATRIFESLDDSRDSALDLLAADALITYAMEASADCGDESAAEGAMKAIGSVVRR